MVTKKQGFGDEGETREVKEGKQGKTRRRVSVSRRGDPGEIQGRSGEDPKGFGVQGCRRKYRRGNKGKGTRREGVGVESKV